MWRGPVPEGLAALDMRRLACEVEMNTTRAAPLDQLADHLRVK
jgi:hypothetical protein